jgi:D-3-phosphoglycerate dehydrogenase / 2-oxoglutarate reductase
MNVITFDPFISTGRAKAFDTKLVDLETLLQTADIVSLHVPLNNQTRGMIDAAKLALLQRHEVIVNCARGGVIVERDLLAALDSGVLAGPRSTS